MHRMKTRLPVFLLALALVALCVVPGRASVPAGTLSPNDLLINQSGTVGVLSGTDGTFKGDFVSADVGPLGISYGFAIGPDGNLYVSDYFRGMVKRYSGTTGAYIDDFVTGVGAPVGVAFLPDGNLYVASNGPSAVHRFNGRTGAYIDTPVPETTENIGYPQDLVFGSDGTSTSAPSAPTPYCAIFLPLASLKRSFSRAMEA